MADFKTHLNVGSAVGFVLAVFSYVAGWTQNVLLSVLLFFLTVAGSFLPDMDSDSGLPVKIIFGFYAYMAAGMTIYIFHSNGLGMFLSFLFAMGIFALVKFGLAEAFRRYTTHRGIFHSIPAFLISFLLTLSIVGLTDISASEKFAIALAVSLGYLSHLILDEVYAVRFVSDEEGNTFLEKKTSFGTALDMGFGRDKYSGWIAWGLVIILIIVTYPTLRKIYFELFV